MTVTEKKIAENGEETILQSTTKERLPIAKCPVMVRSTKCSLNEEDLDCEKVKECQYD